jgi:hypothetical protein
MSKYDTEFAREKAWHDAQEFIKDNPNGAYYRAPGELHWQGFENKDDINYINPDKANVEILEAVLIGRQLMSAGKALVTGLNKSSIHLQNVANKSISSGKREQQLIKAFSGRLRLETGFESVNRSIQKELGVKIGGAIQKPWHLIINGKEFRLNPLNPLWHFFPKK